MTSQSVNLSDGGDSRATSSASMAEYPPAPPDKLERVREKLAAVEAKLVSSTAREAELRVHVGQLDLALQDAQTEVRRVPRDHGWYWETIYLFRVRREVVPVHLEDRFRLALLRFPRRW